MIRAVIFDMDGVMIDSEPLWERTEKIMMARKGLEYTPVYREKIVGLGQIDSTKLLKTTFSLNTDIEDIINERISILLDIYKQELVLRNGLTELLNILTQNSFDIALASSSPYRVIKFVLDKFCLNEYFNPVVSGDFVEHGKPEPDIYINTAEKLGLKSIECVVIEDSINGVVSAKNAGMHCIAIPDKRLDPAGFVRADIILESIDMIDISKFSQFY
jgi:HAD superfamily hydrolase (TIGR01509 family)